MLLQKDSRLTASDIEEIFPHQPEPLIPERASEILHSHIIMGFEQAVELGMAPIDALSTVLIWVSDEMGRVKAGHIRAQRTHQRDRSGEYDYSGDTRAQRTP